MCSNLTIKLTNSNTSKSYDKMCLWNYSPGDMNENYITKDLVGYDIGNHYLVINVNHVYQEVWYLHWGVMQISVGISIE